MNVTPVFQIEREPWGDGSIPIKVNDGVYICSCSVIYDEYRCKKNMHLFMTVTSNLCTNKIIVGISLIIE